MSLNTSLPGSPVDCPQRRHRIDTSKPHAKFSPAEDEQLRLAIETYGISDWNAVANAVEGKNARQCKERWLNYLAPELNMSAWTREDDVLLLRAYQELGNKWVQIAKRFQNRTDSMVKNRFNKLQRLDRKTREKVPRSDHFLFQSFPRVPVAVPHEHIHMLVPKTFLAEEAVLTGFSDPPIDEKPFDEEQWGDTCGFQVGWNDLFGY
jgi:hypothetical protein